jgi:hypothetical protein
MRWRVAGSAAVGVLMVAAVLVASPRVHGWWSDVVLDSREAQVPCVERPSPAEARRVLRDRRELVRRIEAVDASVLVTVEESVCPGRGTLVFFYNAHRHRKQIERLIGGATFFGIPYSLRNV